MDKTAFFQRRFSAPVSALLLAGLALLLVTSANIAYGLPSLESLKFLLAAWCLFYVPGSLVLRGLVPQSVAANGRFVLALATGLVLVPALYLFFRRFSVPGAVTTAVVIAVNAAWLLAAFKTARSGQVWRGIHVRDLGVVVVLLGLVAVLLHASHLTDIRLTGDGFMIRNTFLTETIYHQGVVNALKGAWPPPAIYASGGSGFLQYHLNMHVQIELVWRVFSINTLHLVYFYVPFLYFVTLASIPYVFARQIGGNRSTGLAVAALVFGTGFSYVAGLSGLANPDYPWTVSVISTVWSIFTLNGIIPSYIALFLFIALLHAYFTAGNRRVLGLLVLVAYGAYGFKTSMGLQVAGISLLTGSLMLVLAPDRKAGAGLSAAAVLMLLAMFLDLSLFRSGAGQNVVAWSPLSSFTGSLDMLGLSELPRWGYPVAFLLILATALGVRLLAFVWLKALLRKDGVINWLGVFLVLFVVGGYVLSEAIFLGPAGEMNESSWFYKQSLMAAWFLVFMLLVRWESLPRARHAVSLLLVLALAAPSTIQFLSRRADDHYVSFDADDLVVVDFLAGVEQDAVVLHPFNRDGPALASNLAGRSSVVNTFRSFVSEEDGFSERVGDVQAFFNASADRATRSEVLNKYGVDYVYGPVIYDRSLGRQPELEKVLSNGKWSLYAVRPRDGT